MIIINRKRGYGAKRKYVQGRGFVDSLTSSLKSIGSYISQNRDLIAKPLLGAVGNLAATGVTEGTKALLNHIISKKAQRGPVSPKRGPVSPKLDEKAVAVLQNIIGDSSIPVTNIIGSGIKKF